VKIDGATFFHEVAAKAKLDISYWVRIKRFLKVETF
jgi:hypothetical protein